jgi:mannose/cellobiose epimerase-like protein (N-acyl-D-glucosamine 2-epimerase family)
MVWDFSNLKEFANPKDADLMQMAAKHGIGFLLSKFWDQTDGGFYWLINRGGNLNKSAKLTYG